MLLQLHHELLIMKHTPLPFFFLERLQQHIPREPCVRETEYVTIPDVSGKQPLP